MPSIQPVPNTPDISHQILGVLGQFAEDDEYLASRIEAATWKVTAASYKAMLMTVQNELEDSLERVEELGRANGELQDKLNDSYEREVGDV